MVRKLPDDITYDDAEDEVLYSNAALKADPDAEDLLPETETWLPIIDQARAAGRESRQKIAETDAARAVANRRLDRACEQFGDDLYLDVDKDRKSKRWTAFFSQAVSRFVRQALPRQVTKVRGWLKSSTDPVLENHRPELDRWSKATDDALTATEGSSLVRGQAWHKREEMARSLTRERDGLWETLAERARERNLPRDWPDVFFRVARRASREAPPEPAAPPAPSPDASPTPTTPDR